MNRFDCETAINKVKNYSTLVSFLGSDWIRKIISGDKPKFLFHPLRNALLVNNPSYEAALKSLNKNLDIVLNALKQSNSDYKINNLRGNLKGMDRCPEAVAEIEWFAKWISKGLPVIIEPNYPESGPDAKVTVNGTDVYCEITMVNLADDERKAQNIRNELLDRVKKIGYNHLVRIGLSCKLDDSDVNSMVEFIRKEEAEFEKQGIDEKTIHYGSAHKPKAEIYVKKHVTRSVYVGGPGEGSKLNHRIKRIIIDKVNQLKKSPHESPKIVILDLSRHLGASTYAEWDIFGQEIMKMYFENVMKMYFENGNCVRMKRVRSGGAFSKTTTVSAVIITKRIFDGKDWKLTGEYYRNSNANIPINEDILRTLSE